MAEPIIFEALGDAFQKVNAFPILAGGFALNHYNISRQTVDIDFLIEEKDYQQLLPYLKDLGYTESHRDQLFARWSRKDSMPLDFLFLDGPTSKGILQDSQKVQIAGREFHVPSLTHLMAMKLHAIKQDPEKRQIQDLADIIQLAQANGVDIHSKEFEALCRKFGPERIHAKIKTLGEK